MPLDPKDINEKRDMALANSLWRVTTVLEYVLGRISLSNDEPHKEHQQLAAMRDHLRKTHDTLQTYFLGD